MRCGLAVTSGQSNLEKGASPPHNYLVIACTFARTQLQQGLLELLRQQTVLELKRSV